MAQRVQTSVQKPHQNVLARVFFEVEAAVVELIGDTIEGVGQGSGTRTTAFGPAPVRADGLQEIRHALGSGHAAVHSGDVQ